MKNLVVLNALNCLDYSFEKIFNSCGTCESAESAETYERDGTCGSDGSFGTCGTVGKSLSAFEMSIKQAFSLDFCQKIVILVSPERENAEQNLERCAIENAVRSLARSGVEPAEQDLEIVSCTDTSVSSVMKILAEKSDGYENLVYEMADYPFYNIPLVKKMFDLHTKSAAEYTFADGYATGFSPEILNSGTAKILSLMCEQNEKWQKMKIKDDSIFELLKTDINSFEIETYISDGDYRANRFNFSCRNKNSMMQCKILFEKYSSLQIASCYDNVSTDDNVSINETDVEKLSQFSETLAELQQTLPQYYSIQICTQCNATCSFCPYPSSFYKKFGYLPNVKNQMMSYENFSSIIDNISSFSGEAVVCLSLWGEAILNPQLDKFIEKILSYTGLSVLIELSGQKFDTSILDKISQVVKNAKERTNGGKKIYWIVSLDATDEKKYDELHNDGKSCAENSYEVALHTLSLLISQFPECVYPQFLRLTENEDSLESFWRSWNEKNGGNLIIKKYDWFSGLLEQKKTADLSPINRNVCWHLRRDFNILFDGSVPICQSALLNGDQGNVFTETLESIWEKRRSLVQSQMSGIYNSICEKCDEYYIFNF